MTQISSTGGSGPTMAEDGKPSLSADRPSDRDAEPLGHGASPQLKYQGIDALKEELGRIDLSARLARLEEDLRQVQTSQQELRASYQRLHASSLELLGATEWLHVSTGELEASTEAMKAQIKQLSQEQRQHAEMLRWHIGTFHADAAAAEVQALREDCRLHALHHVGISSITGGPGGRPWGHLINRLVKDWTKTFQEVLTTKQRNVLKRDFGHPFVKFLATDKGTTDLEKANTPALTIDIHMPCGRRAFLMEAINLLRPAAVRNGGRQAYFIKFKGDASSSSSSIRSIGKRWAEEREKLAATSRAGPRLAVLKL